MRRVVLMLVTFLATVTEATTWPVVRTYQGETLRRVKMPLGGVGTGTISLAGNGDLVDWEIRSRYDGRKRNPFDEAECGHHYVRALASWTVLRAFIGAGKCL